MYPRSRRCLRKKLRLPPDVKGFLAAEFLFKCKPLAGNRLGTGDQRTVQMRRRRTNAVLHSFYRVESEVVNFIRRKLSYLIKINTRRLALALHGGQIQTSKHPKAYQHQQDGGNCNSLVDPVLCLPGARLLTGGRWHGDGCGWGGGLHREPAFLCLSTRVTDSGAGRFHFCFLDA
jgi:hypothetical protein